MTPEEQLYLSDLNYMEMLRDTARYSGGRIIEEGGALLTAGPIAHPVHNSTFRTDPKLPVAEFIARVREFYARIEHGYGLILREHIDGEELAAAAREAGLVSAAQPPALALAAPVEESALADGVELRTVVDDADVRDFGRVAGEAWTSYGIPAEVTELAVAAPGFLLAPHVRAVNAYVEGVPAAGALILLSHGIAGVYWVSTLGNMRGRGLADAVTRRVSNLGFELGARLLILQASVMGDAIYRRMGYVELSKYQLFFTLGASA